MSNAKRVSLELGGKSPLIIFGDCDMDKAVRQVELMKEFSSKFQCPLPFFACSLLVLFSSTRERIVLQLEGYLLKEKSMMNFWKELFKRSKR